MSPLSNSRPMKVVATWLCATFSIGCTAAPVRPPSDEDCPPGAVQSMEEMNLFARRVIPRVVLDINQPGDQSQDGIYRQGSIVSKVVESEFNGSLPEGTLLYGQLWTEGIRKEGKDAALVRWTEALLPDGRRFPVCFAFNDRTGRMQSDPGDKPGEVRLPREWDIYPVRGWL